MNKELGKIVAEFVAEKLVKKLLGPRVFEGELTQPGENHFKPTKPSMWALGTQYGPLQTDGYKYLCPDCGGYCFVPGSKCKFCEGQGFIELFDVRIVDYDPRKKDQLK